MSPVEPLTARRLAALLARDQVDGRLPSVAAGVVRDGELAWVGSCGDATGLEATADAADVQYRIGSITKTLVAGLVLELRDEGRLDLNDRLDAHLPGVAYGDRTLRSLLSHSSGMHSEPVGSWWERSPGGSFDDLVADLDEADAPFPAGTTYHYTNIAFGLLGEMVARLRGAPWFDVVQERILTPLGMHRTSYLPSAPAATGYSVDHFAGTLTEEPSQDTGAMAPAGQVWSTVADLARYAGFLVAGHPDVLAAPTLDEMATLQSATRTGAAGGGYGLGLRLVHGDAGTLVGHTGSMPGYLAFCFADRSRRTAAVGLANGTAGLRCEGLPVELLSTLEECEPTLPEPWRPTRAVPGRVSDVLGVWYWGNTAFGFSWNGHEVVATGLASGLENYRFVLGGDRLVGTSGYHHGERLEAVRNDDGSVSHLVCATFVYTRTPYDPAAPIPGGHPTR